MIFDLKIEGMNSTRIAEYLDSIGVPSPAQRLLEMGYKCGIFPDECRWTHQAVARILSDETYIGTMVQGKRKKVSFKKEKMVGVSRENWIRVEDAVTPIISKRDFEFVQDLGQRDTSTAKDRTHVHLFAGFARCGDCGQNMMHFPVTQHGNTYCFYACSENRQKKTCSSHRIREDKLMRSVAAAMREQIEYLLLVADKLKERQDVPANRLALTSIDEKIKETLDEIAKCQKAKTTIYEDKIAGLLDRESFVMMTELYTNRQKKAEDTMEALQLEKQKLIEDRYHLIPWIESLREFRGFTQLTRRMLVTMVQDIFVYEGGKVEVIFKYSDQIADILRMVLEEGEEITVPRTREIVIEDMPKEEPMQIPNPTVPELVIYWEPDFVDANGVEVGCIPGEMKTEMAVV